MITTTITTTIIVVLLPLSVGAIGISLRVALIERDLTGSESSFVIASEQTNSIMKSLSSDNEISSEDTSLHP